MPAVLQIPSFVNGTAPSVGPPYRPSSSRLTFARLPRIASASESHAQSLTLERHPPFSCAQVRDRYGRVFRTCVRARDTGSGYRDTRPPADCRRFSRHGLDCSSLWVKSDSQYLVWCMWALGVRGYAEHIRRRYRRLSSSGYYRGGQSRSRAVFDGQPHGRRQQRVRVIGCISSRSHSGARADTGLVARARRPIGHSFSRAVPPPRYRRNGPRPFLQSSPPRYRYPTHQRCRADPSAPSTPRSRSGGRSVRGTDLAAPQQGDEFGFAGSARSIVGDADAEGRRPRHPHRRSQRCSLEPYGE